MDDRNNKISGSGMASYALCAGKFNAEQDSPEKPSNAAADMGTRIHEYIATGKGSLTEAELAIAELCKKFYAEAIDSINMGDITNVTLENRFWYEQLWSGQIDRIDHIGNEIAIVTDYKTGRIGTGEAAENLQLRAYAVLVKKNFPELKQIFVCIVQPMVMSGSALTIAEYDESSLALADKEIAAIVERAYDHNAKRTPSPDACKYCRAKDRCPEAQGQTQQLAVVDVPMIVRLTNDQLSEYLDRAEIVEDVIAAIKTEAKKRLKQGELISGYVLNEGKSTRSIENAEEAFGKLQSVIDAAEFSKCCKVSVPQLEKIVAKATQTPTKDAKAKLAELLGETLETKKSDSIMNRVK